MWFYLYLIMDNYSPKIIAWEMHATDDTDHAVRVVECAALVEGIAADEQHPVLHGDNSSTLNTTTVLAMLNCVRRIVVPHSQAPAGFSGARL
ncbi:hypothetical protein WJ39_17915 [Burkholderia diffusa]|nr:hypothetical protein WJ39_17915 [Burkholderia diffusa]